MASSHFTPKKELLNLCVGRVPTLRLRGEGRDMGVREGRG